MDLTICEAVSLFLFTFSGYTIQSITGFGAVIFALPLSMLFVSRLDILAVFLTMSIYQSLNIAYKDRNHINKINFLKMFGLAILGMIFGILMGDVISELFLNISLGVFIILNSISSLYLLHYSDKDKNILKPYHLVFPILSGIMQSSCGMGGPLIAIYMDKLTEDKKCYRGTLSLYWGLLNPFIIIGYFVRGQIFIKHLYMFLLLFPAVLLGIFVGTKVITEISVKKFKMWTYVILIFIGMTLFF